MNFGNATNLGAEIDIMKYFNWFGIKANYTYTHSKVTTDKRLMDGSEVTSVLQSRPLFGQAAHVANLSLLFKETKYQWEGQLAFSYTGKRLSDISNWYNDDIWEAGYSQLDASVEKSFKNGISIFAKASNLLDIPLLRFIQNGPHTESVQSERHDGNVIERKEWHEGNVSGVWEANSVIKVSGHIVVPEGESLTIQEGVQVIFDDAGVGANHAPIEFTVDGNLYCEGTAENPIRLTVAEEDHTEANTFAGLWGGIVASNTLAS